MSFCPIDLDTWPRRPWFEHYLSGTPCTYSMTVPLDITGLPAALKQAGMRLYPALIFCISRVVNAHEELRTALDKSGRPGVYDRLDPSYTIFHCDTHTFSALWTEHRDDFEEFFRLYEQDQALYGKVEAPVGKPPAEACFNVSMIPWAEFTAFNLNLQKGYDYLLPIFTLGRCTQRDGRLTLPFAIQVHHAVCDGWHASRLACEVQQEIDRLRTRYGAQASQSAPQEQ